MSMPECLRHCSIGTKPLCPNGNANRRISEALICKGKWGCMNDGACWSACKNVTLGCVSRDSIGPLRCMDRVVISRIKILYNE